VPAGGRRPDSTEGDTFYIHLDLPGIRADSITFTVEQNVLTVRAERTGSKQRQRSREVHEPGRSRSAGPLDRL
jgi:HSP20 family molecular chaperone IbpA